MKTALLSAIAFAGALAFAGSASADSVTIAAPPPSGHVVVHEHVVAPPPVEHDHVVIHEGRSSTGCSTKKKTVEHMNGNTTTKTKTNCD